MLLDDSRRYVNRARSEGSPAALELWPDMIHVFQLFERMLPEARQALDHAAAFLQRHRKSEQPVGHRLVDKLRVFVRLVG